MARAAHTGDGLPSRDHGIAVTSGGRQHMTTETEQSTTTGTVSRLESFIDAMIDMGQTGQIFGEHGIGKTATFFAHIARAHPGTTLVYVPAANLTPDDLLVNAPVRDPHTGELVLRQLVMSQLKPGTPFVLPQSAVL